MLCFFLAKAPPPGLGARGEQMELSWGEEGVYCVHRVQLLIWLEPKSSLPSPQGQGWHVLGPLIFKSLGLDVLST